MSREAVPGGPHGADGRDERRELPAALFVTLVATGDSADDATDGLSVSVLCNSARVPGSGGPDLRTESS